MQPLLLRSALCLTLLAALPGCGGRADEKARRKIHDAGFAYSVDDFQRAAREGRGDLIQLFLTAGMHPDAAGANGDTAMTCAAAEGHGHVVSLLLANGATPNAASSGGQTALMAAARSGDGATVKTLLSAGADPRAKDTTGLSPLAAAVIAGHVETVALLAGDSSEGLDHALQLAAVKGHTAVIPVLLDKGASLLAAGTDGRTAIMFAAQHGHLEAATLLRQRGAPVTTLDAGQKTAADLAEENGHPGLAAWLRTPDRNSDPLDPEITPVRLPEIKWTADPPASLPALAGLLEYTEFRSATLPFTLTAVAEGDTSAVIRFLSGDDDPVTVAPGEEIIGPALIVEKVHRRLVTNRQGRPADASEMLLRPTAGGSPILLVKGLPPFTGQPSALLTLPGISEPCDSRPGDTFQAGPLPVKVTAVTPAFITLQHTGTGEEITLRRAG